MISFDFGDASKGDIDIKAVQYENQAVQDNIEFYVFF